MLILVLVVLILLVAALGLAHWRMRTAIALLQQDQLKLTRALARQGNDLAGMSSAGVHLDRTLADHGKRLRECLERCESIREEPVAGNAPPTYHGPIERIRQGASAEELVSEFGISLSEAKLLVRLHGSPK